MRAQRQWLRAAQVVVALLVLAFGAHHAAPIVSSGGGQHHPAPAVCADCGHDGLTTELGSAAAICVAVLTLGIALPRLRRVVVARLRNSVDVPGNARVAQRQATRDPPERPPELADLCVQRC